MSVRFVSHSELDRARSRIRAVLIEDARSKSAHARFPNGVFAGGQYLNEPQQRGLLGTVATLRVLAPNSASDAIAREMVSGIVGYLRGREAIELPRAKARGEMSTWRAKLSRDEKIVVRQAELLHALCMVPLGVVDCSDLKRAVADRLLMGKSSTGVGWGDVLGGYASKLLPTAHAIRALTAFGVDVSADREWLLEQLVEHSAMSDPAAELVYVDCFATLVLVECGVLVGRMGKQLFDYLFQHLERELDVGREVSTDIRGLPRAEYVRLPWQLHLVAVAALVRPLRGYFRRKIQKVVGEAVEGVLSPEGFRYRGSGDGISVRTYGYLWETFSIIQYGRAAFGAIDAVAGRVLRSAERPIGIAARVVQVATSALVVGIIAWSVSLWMRHKVNNLAGLAPNFIAAIVIAAFGWSRRNRRT